MEREACVERCVKIKYPFFSRTSNSFLQRKVYTQRKRTPAKTKTRFKAILLT